MKQFVPLSKNSHIGIVPLSSPLNPVVQAKAIAALTALTGYVVLEPLDSGGGYGTAEHLFSVASPQERAQAFHALIADEQVGAVLMSRGGYGSFEVLQHLDFKLIADSAKPIIGFSDSTVVINAISAQSGLVTVHGPTLLSLFGVESNREERVRSGAELFSFLEGASQAPCDLRPLNTSVDVEGVLYGGNLLAFQSMLATPWQLDTSGAILFFEETGESPYRVHRALLQLKSAGLFDSVRAVIFGDLSSCKHASGSPPDCTAVISDIFKDLDIPVFTDLEVGHLAFQRPLPVGATVAITSNQLVFDLSSDL